MQTKRFTRLLGAALSLACLLVLAACGGGSNVTFTADTSKQLQLVAGSAAGQGVADGDAATARFGQPRRISVNAAGTIFMEDSSCRFLRIQDGVTITMAAASLCDAYGGIVSASQIVGQSDNSLLVVVGDSKIYRIAADGSVSTVFDFADGSLLYGLAVGPDGAYYVVHESSAEDCALMRVADSGGALAASVYAAGGACGMADGAPGTGQLAGGIETRLLFAPSGELYVQDFERVRWITTDGTLYTVPATFPQPLQALTVDAAGRIYVSLQSTYNPGLNSSDQGGTVWRLTLDGTLIFMAGQPSSPAAVDGTGAAAGFGYPGDISADAAGNLWVADDYGYAVRKVTPAGIVTTAYGTLPQFGATDARGAAARLSDPEGLALDGAGNIFVADYGNCELRKIDPTGVVSTLAGTTTGCNYENMQDEDTRTFGAITSVVADGAGGLYVGDGCALRKVSASGAISAFVGTRSNCAVADGTGTDASLGYIAAMAIDGMGNLYLMDYTNEIIRKVTPAGTVTTLAGTSGVTGHTDGPGSTAVFGQMVGMGADAAGNVYISEFDNHDIRRIDPTGVVSTLAGSPAVAGNADGTGAAATFANPGALAVTPDGSIVVFDQGWDAATSAPVVPMSLRLVKPDGSVLTILANANISNYGVLLGKAPQLNFVSNLAVDADGAIFMTIGNAVLRYGVGQ